MPRYRRMCLGLNATFEDEADTFGAFIGEEQDADWHDHRFQIGEPESLIGANIEDEVYNEQTQEWEPVSAGDEEDA